MRRLSWLACALTCALACPSGDRGAGEASAGEPAPPFVVDRLEGEPLRLQDLRGRFVLLDFWATWCPPCEDEIPELNAFLMAHRERGVEVLAISVDALPRAEVGAWLAERDVQYPVAFGDVALAETYGAFEFPYHVLISPDGLVVERLEPGYHDRDELAAIVAPHLAAARRSSGGGFGP